MEDLGGCWMENISKPGLWTRVSNSSSVLVIARDPADSQGMLSGKASGLMVGWGNGCTILYYQQ